MIVYRVKLLSGIVNCAKFRARNPHEITGSCFYVGSTALPVLDRLYRHFIGGLGGNHIIAMWSGCEDHHEAAVNCFVVQETASREMAEAMERRYSDGLRRNGHGVWTNVKERR
jgi:hypothetical protein